MNESYEIYLVYGWEIPDPEFVMLGEPLKWDCHHNSAVHAITPHLNWSPEYAGKTVVGVDVLSIMERDITLTKKRELCANALKERLHFIPQNLPKPPEPQFYIFGKGKKMGITLVLNILWLDEDEEPIKGLDTFQQHTSFDQDSEDDDFACVIMKYYIGSMGLNKITFNQNAEDDAIKQLKRAGIKKPNLVYHFISHT